MDKKNVKFVVIGAIAIIAVVFGGLWLTQNWGKSDREVNHEEGTATIADMAKRVAPSEAKMVKSAIDYTEDDSVASELPDIETMPLAVEATTEDYVEIFAVSNIAGKDKNGWMTDLAKNFNSTHPTVDGKEVSPQDYAASHDHLNGGGTQSVINRKLMDIPVEKTWPDYDDNEEYTWTAKFQLDYRNVGWYRRFCATTPKIRCPIPQPKASSLSKAMCRLYP